MVFYPARGKNSLTRLTPITSTTSIPPGVSTSVVLTFLGAGLTVSLEWKCLRNFWWLQIDGSTYVNIYLKDVCACKYIYIDMYIHVQVCMGFVQK